jgi:iron-sulfur cluster repair protein YtfE (RIC family)
MKTSIVEITAGWTVNEVVERYPESLLVFGRYGVDSCCGGQKRLSEVAVAHGFSLAQLLADLKAAI